MTFSVVWLPAAQNFLADLWLKAVDKNAVIRASFRIDQFLAHRPTEVGEARGGTERILFEPPLVVLYWIVLDDLRVEVFDVGSTKH